MKATDKLNMKERMDRMLEDDDYLKDLIHENIRIRERSDRLFEDKNNLNSLVGYLKTGSGLSKDWLLFLYENPAAEDELIRIKNKYKTRFEPDNGYAEIWANLGNVRLEEKNYPGAISYFTKSIQSGAGDTYVYYFTRGKAFRLLGEYQKADQDYRKVLKLKPEYLPFLIEEITTSLPEFRESKFRRDDRIEFHQKRELQAVERGLSEDVANKQTGFDLIVEKPVDEFFSLSEKIEFRIVIKAINPDFFKNAHKAKIEIFESGKQNSIIKKPFTIEPSAETEHVLEENFDIRENGAFNWYLDFDNYTAFKGVFRVWLLNREENENR